MYVMFIGTFKDQILIFSNIKFNLDILSNYQYNIFKLKRVEGVYFLLNYYTLIVNITERSERGLMVTRI